MDWLHTMTDEDARILWVFGGYGDHDDFPGARVAVVRMVRGVAPTARRALARHFASLSPREAVAALAALLRALAVRPAGVPLPIAAPLAMSPQRRCHRLTPARAP